MLKLSPAPTTLLETQKQSYELADIFRLYGEAYRQKYSVSPEQRLVMRDVVECRTAVLGGHVDACDSCGGLRISYNSCRNRHCPKCGALAKLEWLERQRALLLPIPYFHVVFTIDHAFNPLAQVNPQAVYELLFQTATDVLKRFGQRYLGGEIGFTAVLHTWGQTLNQHIHLHCLVTGGALAENGRRWQAAGAEFLFPVIPLAAEFRDAFCRGMRALYAQGAFRLHSRYADVADPDRFAELVAESAAKKWQVYAKPPFGDASHMLDYLGRYVNRIAISNNRIVDVSDGMVRFSYRDYQAEGVTKEMSLPAMEFIRRFLQHVLPKGFVRVRHYGLLAPRYRQQKLARCRALIGQYHAEITQPQPKEALVRMMLGGDPAVCPLCGVGQMERYETLMAHPTRRRWQMVVQ